VILIFNKGIFITNPVCDLFRLLEALRRYSDILLDFPLARKQLPWFLAHFLASSSLSPSIFDSDEFERLVPSGKAWDLLLQTLSLLRDLKVRSVLVMPN
jgi:hypothetical protein